MTLISKNHNSYLLKMLFVFFSFFVFQNSITTISASPNIFDQNHHTGISETYTYDAIDSSVGEDVNLIDGLSRILSTKEVRPDHEAVFAPATFNLGLKPGDDGFIYSEGNKIGEVSLNVNVKLNHTQKMIWRAMGWR